MKEARIECLCTEYTFYDLELKMRAGQVEWIPASKTKASKELAAALQVNAVRVDYIERCRMAKAPLPPRAPAPPFVRQSRPSAKPAVRPKEPLDMEEVARRAEEAAARAAEKAVSEGMDRIQKMLKERDEEGAQKAIEGIVSAMAPRTAAVSVTQTTDPVAEEGTPVRYFPSNIVEEDAKGKIEVATEEQGADDMDEAAAALKKTKKGKAKARKPRKSRKKE
jgi:hypothetical protein